MKRIATARGSVINTTRGAVYPRDGIGYEWDEVAIVAPLMTFDEEGKTPSRQVKEGEYVGNYMPPIVPGAVVIDGLWYVKRQDV